VGVGVGVAVSNVLDNDASRVLQRLINFIRHGAGADRFRALHTRARRVGDTVWFADAVYKIYDQLAVCLSVDVLSSTRSTAT